VLARPASREALAKLVRLSLEAGAPLAVLGSGFNTLALDAGFRGVVVRLHALRDVRRAGSDEVLAEAGATHSRIGRFCAAQGRSGLEFSVGIPGTAGGWLAMNAGIRGREMQQLVTAVELLDPETGELRELAAAELRFQYRRLELPRGALITQASFRTEPDDPDAIRSRMQDLLAERRATQPVDQLSFGSVFKNPPGDFAGRLIEAVGLKGARSGGAEISRIHANFIVNQGGASANDVLRLMESAREEVLQQFGIDLEPEVRFLGEAS
jgi:UDP-N-acetylmuramate dehydrogenase